jgi:hypothetical protein
MLFASGRCLFVPGRCLFADYNVPRFSDSELIQKSINCEMTSKRKFTSAFKSKVAIEAIKEQS